MKPYNINLDEFDDVFEWLFENEEEMYAAIFERLEYAFANNKKRADIFKFSGTTSIISIDVVNTGVYLDKALKHFEAKEEYEKCSLIMKWKDIIKIKTKQNEYQPNISD